MGRQLLGTTALIGAALLVQPAAAQLEVTVGGTVGFMAGYADFDGTAFDDGDPIGDFDADGFDFKSESEIVIRADGVADNGLEYGAKVEILTSTNDVSNADEVSLYVGGGWGRLEFGDFDGAADEMKIYAPVVGIEQIDGDWTDWVGGEGSHFLWLRDSGDSTKINYYTPDFSGFRLGVAYAPHTGECGDGEEVCIEGDADGIPGDDEGFENFVELGVAYEGNFGNIGVIVSAAYTSANGIDGNPDINDWAVGANLLFGPITVGGAYVDLDGDAWGANAGIAYTVGPWGIAASYAYNDFDDGDVHTYGVGATYALAPGLSLSADLVGFNDQVFVDDGEVIAAGSDGWVAMTGIEVAF